MDKYDVSMPDYKIAILVAQAAIAQEFCLFFTVIVVIGPMMLRIMGH